MPRFADGHIGTREPCESAPLQPSNNAGDFSGMKIRTKSAQSTGPERNRGERADFGLPGRLAVNRSGQKAPRIIGFYAQAGQTENGFRRGLAEGVGFEPTVRC